MLTSTDRRHLQYLEYFFLFFYFYVTLMFYSPLLSGLEMLIVEILIGVFIQLTRRGMFI